ncbi:MAG: hypothetical protein MN733_24880, partial [Nitrososphaera sp.]|nr:hypothetical protein [Nitrososphaera sp.]
PTEGLRRSWAEWADMAERHCPVETDWRAKYNPPLDNACEGWKPAATDTLLRAAQPAAVQGRDINKTATTQPTWMPGYAHLVVREDGRPKYEVEKGKWSSHYLERIRKQLTPRALGD